MLRMENFFLVFFNVFQIFVNIFVHNEIYRLSVVTYLIFEFSFQHVLFTCIRYYVCIVHILCENAQLFSLEY